MTNKKNKLVKLDPLRAEIAGIKKDCTNLVITDTNIMKKILIEPNVNEVHISKVNVSNSSIIFAYRYESIKPSKYSISILVEIATDYGFLCINELQRTAIKNSSLVFFAKYKRESIINAIDGGKDVFQFPDYDALMKAIEEDKI